MDAMIAIDLLWNPPKDIHRPPKHMTKWACVTGGLPIRTEIRPLSGIAYTWDDLDRFSQFCGFPSLEKGTIAYASNWGIGCFELVRKIQRERWCCLPRNTCWTPTMSGSPQCHQVLAPRPITHALREESWKGGPVHKFIKRSNPPCTVRSANITFFSWFVSLIRCMQAWCHDAVLPGRSLVFSCFLIIKDVACGEASSGIKRKGRDGRITGQCLLRQVVTSSRMCPHKINVATCSILSANKLRRMSLTHGGSGQVSTHALRRGRKISPLFRPPTRCLHEQWVSWTHSWSMITPKPIKVY